MTAAIEQAFLVASYRRLPWADNEANSNFYKAAITITIVWTPRVAAVDDDCEGKRSNIREEEHCSWRILMEIYNVLERK